MPILNGKYVTEEYYAWAQAEAEKERIRQKYRQLRGDLLAIQNNFNELKTGLNNLENDIETLLKVDNEIYECEEYNAIKFQVNKVLTSLCSTISEVNKEC